jgi:hypothetical protein
MTYPELNHPLARFWFNTLYTDASGAILLRFLLRNGSPTSMVQTTGGCTHRTGLSSSFKCTTKDLGMICSGDILGELGSSSLSSRVATTPPRILLDHGDLAPSTGDAINGDPDTEKTPPTRKAKKKRWRIYGSSQATLP